MKHFFSDPFSKDYFPRLALDTDILASRKTTAIDLQVASLIHHASNAVLDDSIAADSVRELCRRSTAGRTGPCKRDTYRQIKAN